MRDGPGATPLPITLLGLTIATTLYAGYETGVLPQGRLPHAGLARLAIRSALSRR